MFALDDVLGRGPATRCAAAAAARRARGGARASGSAPTRSTTRSPNCCACARSASQRAAGAPTPKIIPLDAGPADDAGAERHQPVQPELHVLLRVRRGQDRRHRERQAAEVHERGDGARERRVHAAGVGRQQGRAHHVLRRRDADELPGAQVDRSPTRAQRAAELGKDVDFSLTTNATLLKPDIIEFLAENRVGVTISIDGPQEVQDKFRVFHNGAGSYDVVAPKIKELLARHRTPADRRARHAHVRQTLDVKRIYQHLTEEMGFWEVGFAPVTTAPSRDHAIGDGGFDDMLGAVPRRSPHDFLEASLAEPASRLLERASETLEEIHKGVSKAYPCGAGLGLLGVADRRRRRALPPLRRIRRAQARHGARRHRSRARSRRSSSRITSRTRPTAAPAGRGRSARAAAITRRTRATATTDAAEPALLRLDPRLDRHLPADLRRARRAQPGVPARSSTSEPTKEPVLMNASEAGQPQGRARSSARTDAGRRRAAARAAAAAARSGRTFRSAARWCSRRAGKPIAPAAPPACASRSSATCSTATSAASGRRRCPISSITRRTGRQVRRGPEGLAQDRPHLPVTSADRRAPSAGCHRARASSALLAVSLSVAARPGAAPRSRPTSPRSPAATARCYIGTYPKQYLDHRRGHREDRRHDPAQDRHSAPDARCRATASASTRSTRRWRRSRSSTSRRARRSTRFTLSEGNKKIRIGACEPDPLQRFVILVTASATKLIDRWEIGAPTLVQYDLRRTRSRARFPGRTARSARTPNILLLARRQADLPVRRQDVLIYETDELHPGRQMGAVAAVEDGLRPPRARRRATPFNDEPASTPACFTCRTRSEPPHHGHRPRRPRGEEASTSTRSARRRGLSFALAPDRKRAYGLFQRDRPLRVLDVRPRERPAWSTARRVQGPAAHGAARRARTARCSTSTWPATPSTSTTPRPIKYLRTITLDGDMTTELFVLPAAAPRDQAR